MYTSRPPTIAAYGSASYFRNGAAFVIRVTMSRLMRILLSPSINPEINRLKSRYRYANTSRLKNPPRGMPPAPWYDVFLSPWPLGSGKFSSDIFVSVTT